MNTDRIAELLTQEQGRCGDLAPVHGGQYHPSGITHTEFKLILNALFAMANKIEDLTQGEIQQPEAIDEALEKAAFWLSEQSPIVEVTNDSWETLERESLIRSQQIHKAVAGMKMTDGLAEVRIRNLIKRNDEFYGRSLALIMKELGCSYEEAAIFYDGIHDKYLEHPAGNIFQWLREAIQEALLNPKK